MNIWDTFIITPFVNVLLLIYNYIGSFGIAIILFTILIRLVTHPLMVKQIKSAQAMQSLTQDKRYKDMQEKYKGQKEKLAQAQMELYKEMGVSPFASCLPTLIQLPIIIGLYQSLTRAMASTPCGNAVSQTAYLSGLVQHFHPDPAEYHLPVDGPGTTRNVLLCRAFHSASRSWPLLW